MDIPARPEVSCLSLTITSLKSLPPLYYASHGASLAATDSHTRAARVCTALIFFFYMYEVGILVRGFFQGALSCS